MCLRLHVTLMDFLEIDIRSKGKQKCELYFCYSIISKLYLCTYIVCSFNKFFLELKLDIGYMYGTFPVPVKIHTPPPQRSNVPCKYGIGKSVKYKGFTQSVKD